MVLGLAYRWPVLWLVCSSFTFLDPYSLSIFAGLAALGTNGFVDPVKLIAAEASQATHLHSLNYIALGGLSQVPFMCDPLVRPPDSCSHRSGQTGLCLSGLC